MVPPIDRFLYRLSGGRLQSLGPALFPTALITTIGCKSGRERTVTVHYVRDGDRVIVASANFGTDRPSAWPCNLVAHPRRSGADREVGGRVPGAAGVG